MLSNRCVRLSTFRKASHSYQHVARAAFSSTSPCQSYDDTIGNLKIGKDTRVIFQGFTGRQATANAQESIAWGTKIVGGVRPGKSGEHLGLPVLPTVKAAMDELKPDATGIYVAAHQAVGAIEEAIEAEIPLIVVVAEHIPLHDMLRVHSILKTQSKSRLVGANAPGIISSIGHCRIGFQPLPCFLEGHVGVVAKSGTLSYETVGGLTRAGVGQSLVISVGGDVIAGTDFVDALKLFENDDETQGIIMCGELGGRAEEEAAAWIKDYHKRTKDPKPIAALIGGIHARPRTVMGHAGAWSAPGESSAAQKYKILEDAGVTMVNHPAKFGNVMKGLLANSGRLVDTPQKSAASQSRGFHTLRRLPRSSPTSTQSQQRRGLHLRADQATALLAKSGFTVTPSPSTPISESRLLSMTVDRSARSPCIIASPTANPDTIYQRSRHFPFDYRNGPTQSEMSAILAHAELDAVPPAVKAQAANLILKLFDLFKAEEGVALTVNVAVSPSGDGIEIFNPDFSFDDAAFRSTKRHPELHAMRDLSVEDPVEVSAEQHGIVYWKLSTPDDKSANVGTLVNGAGLAMNTVDALADLGGKAANFLDTGGKATSETVKQSFELILQDPRVKVIFVNIFGGLTLGDMIARGVVLAFKELNMPVPVVVRIRGTNEKEGQKIIAESGLDLFAFDDFEDAARKVMELAEKGMKG
ncbi:succinyl-CoA ligase subunit alpha [Rhizodiscina lignyota]|uniref:Succinyl-CoA ligase subunit alpha n=1 Tax=Rhizodiscina lignyota TaxID=1504668 RepID=A0A9P4M9K9_9PEZI|nr:succinyl-CoA ligase subunit alpha [Rhizodiscina lignyota]